jgi:hypothetical protein
MSNTTLETKVVVAGVGAGVCPPTLPAMGTRAGARAAGVRRPF